MSCCCLCCLPFKSTIISVALHGQSQTFPNHSRQADMLSSSFRSLHIVYTLELRPLFPFHLSRVRSSQTPARAEGFAPFFFLDNSLRCLLTYCLLCSFKTASCAWGYGSLSVLKLCLVRAEACMKSLLGGTDGRHHQRNRCVSNNICGPRGAHIARIPCAFAAKGAVFLVWQKQQFCRDLGAARDSMLQNVK